MPIIPRPWSTDDDFDDYDDFVPEHLRRHHRPRRYPRSTA
jgi:hypothetical protein